MINTTNLRIARRYQAFKMREEERIEDIVWMALFGICLMLVLVFVSGCAQAATIDQWADDIHITEGLHSKYPYGIKSVHVKDALEARQVCKRTILHYWRDYNKLTQQTRQEMAFLDYAANRYCPPSVDLRGNIAWKANMYKLLKGA